MAAPRTTGRHRALRGRAAWAVGAALCAVPAVGWTQSGASGAAGAGAPSGTVARSAGAPATAAGATSGDRPGARGAARLAIPGLDAAIDAPADGRDWSLWTRIDREVVTVLATATSGALSVVLTRDRRADPTCESLVARALRVSDPEPFRAGTPFVFHGGPWERQVYRQRGGSHEGELGCLRLEGSMWLATALAQPRAGVALTDAEPVATRLAVALRHAREGYPLRLEASGVELRDPGSDAAWLFLGPAREFPVASDALSSGAGEDGGVTLTVGVRTGSCTAAWDALRAGLAHDGALVDRPGYVPGVFGSRIRRIESGDRTREVYCAAAPRGALVVSAVFASTDGEAMTRLGAMLRVVSATATVPGAAPASGAATTASDPAPAATASVGAEHSADGAAPVARPSLLPVGAPTLPSPSAAGALRFPAGGLGPLALPPARTRDRPLPNPHPREAH